MMASSKLALQANGSSASRNVSRKRVNTRTRFMCRPPSNSSTNARMGKKSGPHFSMRSLTRLTATETTSFPAAAAESSPASSACTAVLSSPSIAASSASASASARLETASLVSAKSSAARRAVPITCMSGVTGSPFAVKSYPARIWMIPAEFTLNCTSALSAFNAPVSLRASNRVNSPVNGSETFTELGSSTSTAHTSSPVSSAAPG